MFKKRTPTIEKRARKRYRSETVAAGDHRRRSATVEKGLAEIDAWHRWFTEGHRQRLMDLNLPREQFDRELADALKTGAAVVARMREDFLSRTPKP